MSPRIPSRLLAAVALIAVTASAARADIITTMPAFSSTFGQVAPPGTGAATTVGQVFTAGGAGFNVLNSYTFLARDTVASPSAPFEGLVYQWNGSAIVGPALFTSAPFQVTGQGLLPYTLNTGALALTPGQQYVALFTAIPFPANGAGALFGITPASAYLGGKLVYNDSPAILGLFSPTRYNYGGDFGNLAFTLTFAPAAAVPEPGPLALAALASLVCGVPVLVKRRNRKSVPTV